MSLAASDDCDITYALVCVKTGALLEGRGDSMRLNDLAVAVPELFRAGSQTDLGSVFTSLGSERSSGTFQEIVFVSNQNVHVVQRLSRRPDVALVALSPELHKLGMMLSGIRARLLSLESES